MKPDSHASWFRAARRTSMVAALFTLIVLAMLLADAISSRSIDPVKPVRLDSLQIALAKDPRNESLRAEARRLDREIRSHYFRTRAFAIQGVWLLLGGIGVFLLALESARRLRPAPPVPRARAISEYWMATAVSQGAIGALGAALGGFLLVVTVLSRHDAAADYSRQVVRMAAAPPVEKAPPKAAAVSTAAPLAAPATLAPSPAALLPPAPAPAAVTPSGTLRAAPVSPALPRIVTGAPPVLAAVVRKGALAGNARPEGWSSGWPVFRGPTGMGIVGGSLPTEWDAPAGRGVVWKAEVPLPGWNSPIVWQGRIFLSGADANTREVYCFNGQSGALKWRKSVPREKRFASVEVNRETGYAPSTLATDGRRVFALFVEGDLACFDMDGNPLWTRALGTPANMYGHASSLTLYANGLIIQWDQGHPRDGKSRLLALDVQTGETIWEVSRPVGGAWSTPTIMATQAGDLLVTTAEPFVTAYDPRTGAERWRAECLRGDVVPSAVMAGGLVFAAMSGADLAAIRPDLSGDVTKAGILWRYPDDLPEIVSPLATEEVVIIVSTDGFVTCLETKTGTKLWDHDFRSSFHASPVLAGSAVYLTDTQGVTCVFEAGRQFRLLARNPLGEKVSASAAAADGRLYLRGERNLYCIGDR